jgi:hypothetical protein
MDYQKLSHDQAVQIGKDFLEAELKLLIENWKHGIEDLRNRRPDIFELTYVLSSVKEPSEERQDWLITFSKNYTDNIVVTSRPYVWVLVNPKTKTARVRDE